MAEAVEVWVVQCDGCDPSFYKSMRLLKGNYEYIPGIKEWDGDKLFESTTDTGAAFRAWCAVATPVSSPPIKRAINS